MIDYEIGKLCKTWLLSLNIHKCKTIHFGKNTYSLKYTIQDGLQPRVTEAISARSIHGHGQTLRGGVRSGEGREGIQQINFNYE